MKLRNKRTGEIVDLSEGFIKDIYNGEFIQIKPIAISDKEGFFYDSLDKLSEEWEDYKPAESLIKDEKIRKAVRAWAEVNKISECVCKEEVHCITFETERGMFISFENADPIPPEGNYTIAELCGEEEE